MLTFLIGKRQKAIAWFLFVLFYTHTVGAVYASQRTYYAPVLVYTGYNNATSNSNKNLMNALPPITIKRIDKKGAKLNKPVIDHNLLAKLNGNYSSFAGALLKKPFDTKSPVKTNIGGPGQPEMSTFKSVGADNMVNLFSGDFSYNIPLLDVDGYPINIFYNAEPTMDQEASWVGLGWNINPGTINRNMRGLPDDFNGDDKVTKEQSMKPDITVGVNAGVAVEVVGYPVTSSIGFSTGVFHNSKRGIGLELGLTGEFKANLNLSGKAGDDLTSKDTTAVVSLGASAGLNVNSQTGLTPSVSFQSSILSKDRSAKLGLSTSIDFNSRTGLGDLRLSGELSNYKAGTKRNYQTQADLWSSNISFARTTYTPSIRMPVTNFNASLALKMGYELYGGTLTGSISGYYTQNSITGKFRTQPKDAYGYMYAEKAHDNKNGLMDFNRLNDGSYTYKTPVIAIPVYTYDVFSISGEGTGGSFRGYRGNMGYVRDNYTRTNSGKVNVGIDLGTTETVKVGATIGGVYSATIVGGWETENALKQTAAFRASEGLEQRGFYFKNPGEKAIIDEEYYNNLGGDKIMRPTMGTSRHISTAINLPTATLQSQYQLFNSKREQDGTRDIDFTKSYRKQRDKRSQVISYLTAEEADKVGLDRNIYSYTENMFKPGICPKEMDGTYRTPITRYAINSTASQVTFPCNNDYSLIDYRKKHHISEITVQEGSKRYIYGLPVYQLKQKEVSFSVDAKAEVDAVKGLVKYDACIDNTMANNKGKDGHFQSETVDPYAHSFLLTAILSPDYSDLSGDGITDDDLGTAIKFNYSRVNKKESIGGNSWANMKWRLPVEEGWANFNRALVTDNGDNKGLYTYGEKELWYTHSIESKNMVATFHISPRKDGYGVKGENGGIKDDGKGAGQKKLDRINLYSKADFVKYGDKAKPIKTVHFTYTYKLCKSYAMFSGDAAAGNGKLTLESIYFTYNNNAHQKNKYRFKYAGEDDNNAKYNSTENDRWGNYKPHTQNAQSPVTISNEDQPYTNQNKAQSDVNAATWSLNQVLLPSGAKIDITYEADDYAYVQNKRAAQMTKILGFGPNQSLASLDQNHLYKVNFPTPWNFVNIDYDYIFFDAPVAVNNKEDIRQLYLQDLKQLLLKLWVKVPKDSYGEGYEPMFVYCNIEDYDRPLKADGITRDNTKFYIKVSEAAHNNGSQIMETVNQFLRDQLSSKAFPGSDVGNKSGVSQLAKALYAMANNIISGTLGFENKARFDGWCREIDPNRSAARLCAPNFKKIGGGHRVKRVEITDNFKKMLGSNAEIASTYGQEYDYTTTEMVNNIPNQISSGVASYEPGVGNEENPFREILQYSNKTPLGPTANSNIELPIAEMFFPSPSVGYSRVTVKSIHNKSNKNIKSGVGMQESQFFTTKDFPTVSEFTDFDDQSRLHYKPSPLNKIFNFSKKDYMSLTQGFRVVLNDMNGKAKMQASYAETDLKNPINKTTYFYRMNKIGENKYKLDNVVPVVDGPSGQINNKLMGKDIEVMNDFREHFTFTHSAQIPLNLDFFKIGVYPVLLPTVFRAVFRDESLFRSATTLKIVNEFGILDSVQNIDKGSVVGTKNLVYDAETGEVMVSRTSNEFNKPIYNFGYPAYWANPGMGQAYKNIDGVYKNLLFRNGKIEGGLTETEINTIFESGDEIYVMDNATAGPKDNAGCIGLGTGDACVQLPKSNEYRIWAVDITKDTRKTTKEFIFIERDGTPYNAADADIRIIRSGKRNMMDASVGSTTSMANPIVLKADNITFDKIFINDNTNIVNTGAIEFKEKWKTQDAFYTKTKLTTVTRLSPLRTLDANPVNNAEFVKNSRQIVVFRQPKWWIPPVPVREWKDSYFQRYNTDNLFARQYKDPLPRSFPILQVEYNAKGWLQYDLSAITASKTIVSAKLSLYSHKQLNNDVFAGIHSFLDINGSRIPTPIAPFIIKSGHFVIDPHYGNNQFIIKRVLSPWPGNNPGAWQNVFQNNFIGDVATQALGQRTASGFIPVSDRSLCSNCGNRNSDNRPDVTSMVRNMIIDRDNPAKQYGTFMQFEMLPVNNLEKSVCFNSGLGFSNTSQNPYKPTLSVNYYDRSEAYGLPGNPPEPPSGQATIPYTTIEKVTTCHSIFGKDYMNPYVQGLLGNWRPLKSYVYNGARREYDPSTATNISKDGIILGYETFWSLDAANKQITRTNASSTKWVYNSEITQYNRKGAELENVDPLGRYNTGIYGYNEALPVAVVNNSRLRLSAFDGFEDYFFKDQSCDIFCQPNKRHFETKINPLSQLDATQAHSGKHSFKTATNSTSNIKIKISADNIVNEPDIFIHSVKTQTNVPWVIPKGIGLKGTYYENFDWSAPEPFRTVREDKIIEVHCTTGKRKKSEKCEGVNNLPPGISRCGNISAKWEGKIQVQESGLYEIISSVSDDNVYIDIDDVNIFNGSWNGQSSIKVPLVAGTLHKIFIRWRQGNGEGAINLQWKTPCDSKFRQLPSINLYPLGKEDLANGSIISPNTICTKVDQIKALSNFLIDEFNLIPNQKMIASVWVKKGITDCRCPAYTGFGIKLKDASGNVIPDGDFAPKGNIIEGWQLFEATFNVPAGTEMSFFIDNANSSEPVFIDDLRFHPYNANMKSFVYNPYNLKPAAELDENNYATFYEYDDDGTLIRVKKETKLGIKTIQETRSSLQKTVTDF
jgi:hypothetical protein